MSTCRWWTHRRICKHGNCAGYYDSTGSVEANRPPLPFRCSAAFRQWGRLDSALPPAKNERYWTKLLSNVRSLQNANISFLEFSPIRIPKFLFLQGSFPRWVQVSDQFLYRLLCEGKRYENWICSIFNLLRNWVGVYTDTSPKPYKTVIWLSLSLSTATIIFYQK